MVTCGDICSLEVVSANRAATVQTAAGLMRQHHVGAIVVVDEVNGKRIPVGIVTDRDIVVEVDAPALDRNTITVGDIMAQDPTTVHETDGLLETVKLMRGKGVRRLPVIDANDNLVGIISLDDLLEIFSEEMTEITRLLRRERALETRNRK